MQQATTQFRIVLNPSGIDCRVEMDGVDISHKVRAVQIYAEVSEPTRVVLEFITNQVEIEGEASLEANPGKPRFIDITAIGDKWERTAVVK